VLLKHSIKRSEIQSFEFAGCDMIELLQPNLFNVIRNIISTNSEVNMHVLLPMMKGSL